MATAPDKGADRTFSVDSSPLIDWELDSIKTDQEETLPRSLINYRHLKSELRSQCETLSAKQEERDELLDSPLTVWAVGSWDALEAVDGTSDEAKNYHQGRVELSKKILMLKIQIVCLKLVRVSSCIRQLQVGVFPGVFVVASTLNRIEIEIYIFNTLSLLQLSFQIS